MAIFAMLTIERLSPHKLNIETVLVIHVIEIMVILVYIMVILDKTKHIEQTCHSNLMEGVCKHIKKKPYSPSGPEVACLPSRSDTIVLARHKCLGTSNQG
jgi:hypothetical protein